MNLKVQCIWCKTKTDFNRFARNTKKSEDYDKSKNQIISYNEIGERLSKNDPYGNQPSDTLIGLHIQKIIKTLINKNEGIKEESANVTYLLKNLNQDNVNNFKNFLSSVSEGIEFDLVVINRSKDVDPVVLSKFDNVKFIEDDKA